MSRRDIVYVGGIIGREKEGQYYRNRNRYVSCDDGKTVYKSSAGFAYDTELAYECLRVWRELGFRGGPASPASFFRMMLHRHSKEKRIRFRCNATVNSMLRGYFRGAWIDAFRRGEITERLYQYDINGAYRWASTLGYPSRLRRYRKGDRNYVAVMDNVKGPDPLPALFQTHSGKAVVTSHAVERIGLTGDIIHAVSYDELDTSIDGVVEDLGVLPPQAFKRMTQSFWGCWCAGHPLEVDTVKEVVNEETGEYDYAVAKTRKQYNRDQNFAWAALTVQRVVCKVWKAVKDHGAVQVFVDSVLVPERMPTGNGLGEWKLERYLPDGIMLRAPGVYDELPADPNVLYWLKHSGHSAKIRREARRAGGRPRYDGMGTLEVPPFEKIFG